MAAKLKFNFKDIADLNADIKQSPRAIAAISQRVMSPHLRTLAQEFRATIPTRTGQLARSVFSSVVRPGGLIALGAVGLRIRKIPVRTLVAGNVMQKGGGSVRKRVYAWIPTPMNRNITPQDFFNLDNTFIGTSKAGKRFAFIRQGNLALPMFLLVRNIRPAAPPLPIEQRLTQKLPEINEDIQEAITQVIAAKGAALKSLNE